MAETHPQQVYDSFQSPDHGSMQSPPPYLLGPMDPEPTPQAMPPIHQLSVNPEHQVPGAYPPAYSHSLQAEPRSDSNRVSAANGRTDSPARGARNSSRSPRPVRDEQYADLEKVYIAVMGVTGAGKSKFIQLCTQSREVKVGHGLESCTMEVNAHRFVYRDQLVHLIDTPGFDDTNRSDREVLDEIATWLGSAYTANMQLMGILYLHRVSDTRMGGVAHNNLKMFKKLCGEDFYPRVTLATTMWDIVEKEIAKQREAQLIKEDQFWGRMINGGSRTERHYGDRESAMDILKYIIRNGRKVNAPTSMRVQTEMVEQNLSLDETSAGREVSAKILEERKKYEKQLEEAKQEMREAMDEHDTKAAAEIKKHQEAIEKKLRQGYADQQKLKVKLEDMQRQHQEQLEQMQRVAAALREEMQAAKAELEKKEEELTHVHPNSSEAIALRREIADGEIEIENENRQLEEQEEQIVKKKKNLIHRLYEWAKANPKKVMKGGMIAMQVVTATAAARRQNGASMSQPVGGHPRVYEVEEVESDEEQQHSSNLAAEPHAQPAASSQGGSFLYR